MIKKEFDFDQFRADALKAMYAGKPLTGKDGVLAPLIENLLNDGTESECLQAAKKTIGFTVSKLQNIIPSSMGEWSFIAPNEIVAARICLFLSYRRFGIWYIIYRIYFRRFIFTRNNPTSKAFKK